VLRALKERVAANALELARQGIPKSPFYVAGQVAGQNFSLHAEGERVILTRAGQPREEVELVAPAAPAAGPPAASLPEPVCPHGAPTGPELPEPPPPGVAGWETGDTAPAADGPPTGDTAPSPEAPQAEDPGGQP